MKPNQIKLFKNWFHLLISFLMIYLFIFYFVPQISKLASVKPLIDFIVENDIDASALYYTEIEEFSEAEFFIENSMEYHSQFNPKDDLTD